MIIITKKKNFWTTNTTVYAYADIMGNITTCTDNVDNKFKHFMRLVSQDLNL